MLRGRPHRGPACERDDGKRRRSAAGWTFAMAILGWTLLSGAIGPVLSAPEPPAAGSTAGPQAAEREKPISILKPLVQQKRFAEAEVRAREMLAAAESDHGADSIEAAEAIDAVVALMDLQDEIQGDEALQLGRRAVVVKERILGPLDPEVALSINSLANILWKMGDYGAARPLYERALEIRTKAPGVKPQTVARSIHNLAFLLVEQGQYAASKPLAERAVRVLEESLGPDHDDVAIALNSQATLLKRMGDFQESRRLYERALEIRRKNHGPEAPGCADLMANLGSLLNLMGEHAEARALLRQALSIQEKAHSSDNRVVAETLIELAESFVATREYNQARPLLERALSVQEKNLGHAHAELAGSLQLLANTLAVSGDLALAEPLYARALAIREQTLGPRHPSLALLLNDYARFQWRAGHGADAFRRALRAEMVAREQFQDVARSLSERDALKYERKRARGLDIALSLLASTTKGSAVSEDAALVLDEVIRSRALVLDELAGRHRAILQEPEESVSSLAHALELSRNRLARTVLQNPGAESSSHLEQIRKAQSEKEKIESELARHSAVFRRQMAAVHLGLDEVRGALPAGAALVTYVQYAKISADLVEVQVPSYMAFVLTPGRGAPRAVPLGPAAAIDSLTLDWRKEAGSDPRLAGAGKEPLATYRLAGARLRDAVWAPLAEWIRGSRKVFIVPDGSLSLVSFEALPSGTDRYLVDEPILVQYLSAERDLVRGAGPDVTGAGLLAVGGPDFGADLVPKPRTKATAANPSTAAGAVRSTTAARAGGPGNVGPAKVDPGGATAAHYRGPRAACGALRSLRFASIPGSRAEAGDVVTLWKKRKAGGPDRGGDKEVLRLTGLAADEGTVKRSAPGRRVLHLATHAFFAQQECESTLTSATRSAGAAWGAEKDIGPILGDNPLLLSGLALAGANRRDEIGLKEDAEDGVLTAEEVASLDLSSVEWVVLSGCETGVGPTMAGEGVLGLRRAFEIAGARTLIMSLWPVEDEAARAWMRGLYRERLAGSSTVESVREASARILREQRRLGRTTHPFFWGGFVAAGDWR